MLSFFKKKDKEKPNDVIAFLNKQSDLYIEAIEYKNTDKLNKTFTEDVREYVKMMFNRDDICFGLERYRVREWEQIDNNNGTLVYRMRIKHNNIHVTGKVYVPLGDEVEQIWTIKENNDNYIVTDIYKE